MNQFWQLNDNKVVQIFTSSLEIIVQLSEIKYEKGRFYKEDLTFQIDIITVNAFRELFKTHNRLKSFLKYVAFHDVSLKNSYLI